MSVFVEGRMVQSFYIILMSAIIVYFLSIVKGDRPPRVRQIPALNALPEMVGRAAEVERPIHFTLGYTRDIGLRGPNAASILAGLGVLENLSREAGRMGARLIVSVASPEIIPLAAEIVRQGYAESGNVESFSENQIRFFGTQQWAYASGVLGTFAREQPASNVMVGPFAAEALMFAEAAYTAGAMQLAGTQSVFQTPFFIASCDYAMIGEEIFAAGAYLSKDVTKLRSIRGQDANKIIIISLTLLGVILAILGNQWLINLLRT